jgi:chromosome segregation ATPase
LGDPDAILGAIESNANSLEQAWEDFQTDLKTKPYIAALERYISQLDSRIANAQQQLASLDPTVPGYAETKKELEKELEINQERRDKAQMYLGQLQNGGSVTPSIEAFVESILTNEGNDVTDQTVEVVAYGNATDT